MDDVTKSILEGLIDQAADDAGAYKFTPRSSLNAVTDYVETLLAKAWYEGRESVGTDLVSPYK